MKWVAGAGAVLLALLLAAAFVFWSYGSSGLRVPIWLTADKMPAQAPSSTATNPASRPADAQTTKPTQQAAKPRPAQIDRNGVLILVRSTLLALDQANKTGNYSVLRELGAPAFQAANTPARLSEIFANERKNNLDLSGVAVLVPQLSVLPEIDSRGLLHMAGFFPSVPTQINFEFLYAPVGGQWRLFGLRVGLGQAAPAAPSSGVQTPTTSQTTSDAARPSALPPSRPKDGQTLTR